MKGIDIIEAFQNIDDDMILHARQHRKAMPVWLRWTSVAAVLLCTVILMAMMLARLLGGPMGTNPDPNQPDVLAPVEDSDTAGYTPPAREGLQALTQQALLREIESLSPLRPEGIAGSVVVLDVNSFQVLAAAAASSETGDESPEDSGKLPDRVLSNAGAPGATFQMITAITAMRSGITPDFSVEDNGYYLAYENVGYTPGCRSSGFQGHGTVTMEDALAKNCDTYFYALADSGIYAIEDLNTVAQSFGLGLQTGIGQSESTGQLSTPELKQAYYGENSIDGHWYIADELMVAIGQGLTRVTPMQLCRYTAALANGGTLLPVTMDGSGGATEAAGVTHLLSKEEHKTITEGMRRFALESSVASVLENVGISVCCSADTVTDLDGYNSDAILTCWAPAYAPEIAITVCLTHGGDAKEAASVASDILRAYFGQTTNSVPSGENASVLEPTAEPTSVPTALPTPTPTSFPTPTPTTAEAISEVSPEPTSMPTPTPTPLPTPTPTPEAIGSDDILSDDRLVSVAGVTFGMNDTDVIALLGEPDSSQDHETEGGKRRELIYFGTISCFFSECETCGEYHLDNISELSGGNRLLPYGITLNDSLADVLAILGAEEFDTTITQRIYTLDDSHYARFDVLNDNPQLHFISVMIGGIQWTMSFGRQDQLYINDISIIPEQNLHTVHSQLAAAQ